MIFTIITIAIAVIFIAYGVFAAVAPTQARHTADIVISTLLKRTAGDKARQDVLIERLLLCHLLVSQRRKLGIKSRNADLAPSTYRIE